MADMPEVFDRLAAQAETWVSQPEPPAFELSSDRVLVGADERDRVEVTVKDFKVASIHVDDYWYAAAQPSLHEIEAVIRDAVNRTLQAYWDAELADAVERGIPMGEYAAGVRQLAADFRVAYERAMERMERHL